MLTETQLTEIRNYLLSKKLPIDILIEVNDHFISQISDLQRDENLSFDEAFEKVKENWKEELTFEAVLMGTSQVKFLTKIKRKQNLDFFLFALKIFATILISSFLISNFGNVNIFIYFFSAILILSFSTPLIIKMMNYKNFELSRKYKKIQLNSLQSISNIGSISIMYFFIFFKDFFKKSEQVFYILNGNYVRILNINERNATMLCIMTFILIFLFIFFSIKLYFFAKKVKDVKPFLSQFLMS
jgi:hypothetical protein